MQSNNWREHIEASGEVSLTAVADALGMPDNDVLAFVNREGHGARIVGGTSKYLIWKEDAAWLERFLKYDRPSKYLIQEEDASWLEHSLKYDRLCNELGVRWDENSPKLVGETLESLTEKFKRDRYLNNVPLHKWDSLVLSMPILPFKYNLSLAEGVCIQKHAARVLIRQHIEDQEG